MKHLFFLISLLFIVQWSSAQIFKEKTINNLKIYGHTKSQPYSCSASPGKIVKMDEIQLTNINKVFPGTKFIDVSVSINTFAGKMIKHHYFMKHKGIYYDKNYLNFLEQETNNNKFSKASLEQRISAFATIAFYEKLQTEIHVDSISVLHKNPDGESFNEYIYHFNLNGLIDSGKVWTKYNYIIWTGFINKTNGANFLRPETDKSININILNPSQFELINDIKHYYFDTSSTAAQIKITGLNPNNTTNIYFIHPYNSSTLYNETLTVSSNGEAIYTYNNNLKTGVCKILVINGSSTETEDYKYFIPENRIEGALGSNGYKYRIYSTEMFYNVSELLALSIHLNNLQL